MTETHLEKRLIGYPRVSTYGQTSESQLAQLSRGWLSGRNTASTASKIELVGRDQRWRRSAVLLRHRMVGSTLHHQAGRDGDSEHLSDARIVKAVIHVADGPDHAMPAGARVRGGLERCLIRAQARFLVYLGARIPEQQAKNIGGADLNGKTEKSAGTPNAMPLLTDCSGVLAVIICSSDRNPL
jgi:hypothetical protein